jgi:hypothetical protein
MSAAALVPLHRHMLTTASQIAQVFVVSCPGYDERAIDRRGSAAELLADRVPAQAADPPPAVPRAHARDVRRRALLREPAALARHLLLCPDRLPLHHVALTDRTPQTVGGGSCSATPLTTASSRSWPWAPPPPASLYRFAALPLWPCPLLFARARDRRRGSVFYRRLRRGPPLRATSDGVGSPAVAGPGCFIPCLRGACCAGCGCFLPPGTFALLVPPTHGNCCGCGLLTLSVYGSVF